MNVAVKEHVCHTAQIDETVSGGSVVANKILSVSSSF